MAELPDFQVFATTYADAEDVRVLSINTDADPDAAKAWMDAHGFDFTTLLDDTYVLEEAGVRRFPTTWFVDREGSIVYEQRGYVRHLVQEFEWRVRAMVEGDEMDAGGRRK